MRGNSVHICGNLTRDAEQKSTASGNLLLEWGIAWNESKKNQQTGEYEDRPNYFDCFAWVTPAQMNAVAPQLVKGASCVILEGMLSYSAWETDDGQKRSKVRIKVVDPISGMKVIPPRNGSYRQQQTYQEQPPQRSQTGYNAPAGYAPANQQAQAPAQPQQAYQQQAYQQQQTSMASLYDEDIPF